MNPGNGELNYCNTFIQVAEDCPVSESVVPMERGGRKTVAVLQYEMLSDRPYHYTQEDVLFEVFLRHKAIPASEIQTRGPQIRQEFFARPQACLRASPLPKQYGWGLHFDDEGKIALCAMESEQYAHFTADGGTGLALLKAMRSNRK